MDDDGRVFPQPGDEIAGFRLVRRLGAGVRSEVFLGHAGPPGDAARVSAVKVFRTTTSGESIDAEVRALSAADHAHVVQLRDLSTGEDGAPILVLERLGFETLASHLASRGALGSGEAVTLLAPIAAAVAALQSSGVVHGAISSRSVLFRESGAPVLAGFGHACHVPPRASAVVLESIPEVARDLLALSLLARGVLGRVPGEPALQLTASLSRLEADGFPDAFPDRLAEWVFALAPAAPVVFSAKSPVVFSADSHNAAVPARVRAGDLLSSLAVSEPDPLATRTALGQPGLLARLQALAGAPLVEATLRALRQRIPSGLRTVRRPVWVAAGVGAVALLGAIVLSQSAASPPVASPIPETSALSTTERAAVDGDEPVQAFDELAALRDDCLRMLSVLCLDDALQPGSSALEEDVALLRSVELGGGGSTAGLNARTVELVERHGDAALVRYESNGKPASALLMKGEAGWRIREYFPY